MKVIWFFLFLLLSALANAEIFGKIRPLDKYGDILKKYPNAELERLEPAWATEKDALMVMRGVGISGAIVIKYEDSRPMFRELAEKNPDSPSIAIFNHAANAEDEEALEVQWVRWMPDEGVNVKKLISKFGKKYEKYYDDEMRPVIKWADRGVAAYMSEDELSAHAIEYAFTKRERDSEFRLKYKTDPYNSKLKKIGSS
ncbi:hypothetical protein [Chitinimonas taiwanensis]|uniref:Uncharacterized protein n=1 Tax=Chitinimonas taiwanensis DSM 18899 TaxID=1121279 RepID=A0A1K2HPP0_9NEIS|nr:hypothetical protein [Chitinimonas taiwanensis]SFZ78707.1 hypothetical protein SAMN02745887_03141 [Chitinimonas taiwanensis DSM 18899]